MIVSVVGARPQFVKAAVVSQALKEAGLKEEIVHTGQHYDDNMSKVFWDELGIPPYSINLDAASGSHGVQTARIIEKFEQYLEQLDGLPNCVLLYGDTNSTLAGAIVASKMNIPIVHVEAGLRSFNRTMPEEINRIVTDHLSQLLFCSSEQSAGQLAKEGIADGVHVSGDVMFDAVLRYSVMAGKKISLKEIMPSPQQEYSLLTLHRPVNTDNSHKLKEIFDGLSKISEPIIWPLHPRMKSRLNGLPLPGNVKIVPPFSYLQMLMVLKNATKVLTDSGGLQKEAYWLQKPCITLRDETEWVETLGNNWNIIAGSDTSRILKAYQTKVDVSTWRPLYGNGQASGKIASIIKSVFF